MKKITIAILTILTIGAVQAEYVVKFPLEQSQGGSLPNGSIQTVSPWIEIEPLWGGWVLKPETTLWEPQTIFIQDRANEEVIEQYLENSQSERRNGQRREQNKFTNEIRFIYRPNGAIWLTSETRKLFSNIIEHRVMDCIFDDRQDYFTGAVNDFYASGAGHREYYWNGSLIASGTFGDSAAFGFYIGEKYYRANQSTIVKTEPSQSYPGRNRSYFVICGQR